MSTASTAVSLLGLDPATYVPHVAHDDSRVYRETNCWADVFIELLHARGLEPLAAMGSGIRGDFEGDQWTFFKPRPEEIEHLFGVDIHEMQPYRPLAVQIEEQLRLGRSMLVELDSWFLPDTTGTSYRAEHVKTTVGIEAIDPEQERLRYFHNAGYFELSGEDYRGALRLDPGQPEGVLPPYTELVRFDAGPALVGDELKAASRGLLHHHLGRRPEGNPFDRFSAGLGAAMPELLAGDSGTYHAYAFATVRMIGSTFEILTTYVDWLLGEDGAEASAALGAIVEDSKLLSFKLARRRPFDHEPIMARLGVSWDEAMTRLHATGA